MQEYSAGATFRRLRWKFLCFPFQDPIRTKRVKTRKLIARKKLNAYYKRKKINKEKEMLRYKEVSAKEKELENCEIENKKSRERTFSVQSYSQPVLTGLRGGAFAKTSKAQKSKRDHLQLVNRGTDCFVNSVVQLLRNTDYAVFIKTHVPILL